MISVILPTYNEAENIPDLLQSIVAILRGQPFEIILVDDNSPDGTWNVAHEQIKIIPQLSVIRRMNDRGLSSAVCTGLDASKGDFLVVMDSDGQHDPSLVMLMISRLKQGSDLVIGSRYMSGGSVGDWVRDRRIISRIGTFFCHLVSHAKVSDPLSGFFAMQRDLYSSIRSKVRPTGFKILLEILAHSPSKTRVADIPLIFKMRRFGQSKLSLSIHYLFCVQILRLGMLKIFSSTRGWWSFLVGLSIAMVLTLSSRVYALRLLATNASVRTQVRIALTTVADSQGWLLSDIKLQSVRDDSMTILHQEHGRSKASTFCTIQLSSLILTCNDD